jgi:microcystin-dependent protein
MSADPVFVGEILVVPFNFAPKGFAFCEGQTLPLSQNTALFALLGTTYGGDGKTTFKLPDLRGRVPIGAGQGQGLSNRELGAVDGVETVTLTTAQMPSHTHAVSAAITAKAKNAAGNRDTPVLTVPAAEAAGVTATYSDGGANGAMRAGSVTLTGSPTLSQSGTGEPHSNLQPSLTLNFIIALQGIFPPRP